MSEKVLPITMMILSIGSAIVYAQKGLYKQAWYWISAASITASVL